MPCYSPRSKVRGFLQMTIAFLRDESVPDIEPRREEEVCLHWSGCICIGLMFFQDPGELSNRKICLLFRAWMVLTRQGVGGGVGGVHRDDG